MIPPFLLNFITIMAVLFIFVVGLVAAVLLILFLIDISQRKNAASCPLIANSVPGSTALPTARTPWGHSGQLKIYVRGERFPSSTLYFHFLRARLR